jgi:glutaredoxin
MKAVLVGFVFLLFCTQLAVAATMYRWVDAEGKVHYTDQQPPESAKGVQKMRPAGIVEDTTPEPYAVRQAARKFPVVLYVSDCGEVCDKAREHLKRRGVPYTSKNPQEPEIAEALKKLAGGLQVPVLVVGSSVEKGYEAGAWDAALDAAGYPRSNPLARPAPTKTPAVKSEQPSKPSAAPQ